MTLTKKPRAVLYCRVSSDEQKENTSLDDQEQAMKAFCTRRDIVVDKVYREDFSAKTFERPEWNKLMKYLKGCKQHLDYLFFLDYSRFGRNTALGFYYHSKLLKEFYIEPQSITQWLDYEVPEYVAILGMYLSSPDIENARRSIRTKRGMIARMKEGKYVSGRLPIGYVRDKNTGNVLHSDKAPLVKQAFEMVSRGISMTDTKERMSRLGLYRSLQTWSKSFRNTYYKGIITNPLLDDPVEAKFMTPIIDAHTFDTVQDILNGHAPKVRVKGSYPLKGFCTCGDCNTPLSGYQVSKKQRKSGGYLIKKTIIHYYICNNPKCRTNYSLKKMHVDFNDLIDEFTIDPDLIPILKCQLEECFSRMSTTAKQENIHVKKRISEIKKRREALNIKYIDGHIETEDYKRLKEQFTEELVKCEKIVKPEFDLSNPSKRAEQTLEFVSKMASIWQNGTIEAQTQLQNIVFPKGVSYLKEKRKYRTPQINTMIQLISANMAFKNRKASTLQIENTGSVPSSSLMLADIEPFIRDIELLLKAAS